MDVAFCRGLTLLLDLSEGKMEVFQSDPRGSAADFPLV